METNHCHVVENFAVVINAQREAADQIVFGRLELRVGGTIPQKCGDGVAHDLECFFCLILARLQSCLIRTGLCHRTEITVGTVGQAAFFANLARQTRHETTAPKNVISDRQRKKIRIIARQRGHADQNVRLRCCMRNALLATHRLGYCRQLGQGFTLWQATRKLNGDGIGLLATDITNHGDHGTIGDIVFCMKIQQVLTGNGFDGLNRRLPPVRMVAIGKAPEGFAGDRFWLGQRFTYRRNRTRLVARQEFRRHRRLGQQTSEQSNGLLTLGLGRERAYGHTRTVGASATTALRGNVSNRIGDLRFAHGWLGTAIGQRGSRKAACQHRIGQGGRAGLAGRITSPARIKIHVHIQNRNRVVFNEINTRAVRQCPVLNIQGSVCVAGNAQQGNDPDFFQHRISLFSAGARKRRACAPPVLILAGVQVRPRSADHPRNIFGQPPAPVLA